MNQTPTTGGEQKEFTDVEYIRDIAKKYANSPVKEFQAHHARLQSIALDLEELETRRPKTETELVWACNALARQFYKMHGNEVPEDFRFWEAHHPMEKGMWNMAVAAYAHIDSTDIRDALLGFEEDA